MTTQTGITDAASTRDQAARWFGVAVRLCALCACGGNRAEQA